MIIVKLTENASTTKTIKVISLIVNPFLKYDPTIIAFFKSIIGPSIKNPDIAGSPKWSKNPFAINASASEHKESKKESNIITIIAKYFPFAILFSIVSSTIVINILDRKDPNM